jgi:hypothetical protein
MDISTGYRVRPLTLRKRRYLHLVKQKGQAGPPSSCVSRSPEIVIRRSSSLALLAAARLDALLAVRLGNLLRFRRRFGVLVVADTDETRETKRDSAVTAKTCRQFRGSEISQCCLMIDIARSKVRMTTHPLPRSRSARGRDRRRGLPRPAGSHAQGEISEAGPSEHVRTRVSNAEPDVPRAVQSRRRDPWPSRRRSRPSSAPARVCKVEQVSNGQALKEQPRGSMKLCHRYLRLERVIVLLERLVGEAGSDLADELVRAAFGVVAREMERSVDVGTLSFAVVATDDDEVERVADSLQVVLLELLPM